MTPADDIIETGLTRRPARLAPRRKRAPARGRAGSRSPAKTKARRKTTPIQPENIWTHLRPKLLECADLAVSDAYIGLATIGVIYFGSSWVMLALIGVDWLLGTSLANGPDWFFPTKLTAIAAFSVWGIFLCGPAIILARMLEVHRDWALAPWRSHLKRVRPMVGAIALCLGLYGGYQVFDHAPPLPQWEGEYVTPKTDVWLAQSASRSFETLARNCLPEVDAFGIRRWHAKVLDTPPPPPLSPSCNRPDVLEWARRWEARFLVEWATELAPSRNAMPTWVEHG